MPAWNRFSGLGTNGAIQVDNPYKRLPHGKVTRDNFDNLTRGIWCRNRPVGGGQIPGTAAGDVDLPDWTPVEIDDTDGALSAVADPNIVAVHVRFRYRIRVSDSALVITPKLFYGTDPEDLTAITNVATISGEAACSADDADYSGANQYQFVEATLPGGGILSLWKAAVTVGGVPAAGLSADVRAWLDIFVEFP